MGEIKDLGRQKAQDKMKEMAEDAKLCMFVTAFNHAPFHVRPMAVQEVEEDGHVWFFSGADTQKNADIRLDNRVQLIFSNRPSSEFMSLYGTAEIVKDKQKAKDLWNVFLTTWFPGGVDDPNLTMIRFTPSEGHYWDTKNNKMVQSIKIAIGAIRGKMMDDGVEGEMKLGSGGI